MQNGRDLSRRATKYTAGNGDLRTGTGPASLQKTQRRRIEGRGGGKGFGTELKKQWIKLKIIPNELKKHGGKGGTRILTRLGCRGRCQTLRDLAQLQKNSVEGGERIKTERLNVSIEV